jgi:effector-binding domain-containing protein
MSDEAIVVPSYTPQIENASAVPLAVVRRRASAAELSRLVPQCCGIVWMAMREQKVKAGRHVAIYWNGDIQLEVGVEVEAPFVEQGGVVRSATPAGPAAHVTHFGPYGGLDAAHDAVQRWCVENGRRLAGPSWEIYGHWQEAWNDNPALIRTDVYYQVATA